jgi:transposase
VLDWPPYSPDLNPIEHLWHYVKQKLARYKTIPKTKDELWERIETEWNRIPQDLCRRLVDRMEKRIKAVIKRKDGYIKY